MRAQTANNPRPLKANMPSGLYRSLSALALLSWLVLLLRLPIVWHMVGWSLVWCVVAFLAYWLDKDFSRRGQWRISEWRLQQFSLLGGWPGALLAQTIFRHKTKKRAFQQVFWGMVGLHLACLYVLARPEAQPMLHRVGAWVHAVVM